MIADLFLNHNIQLKLFSINEIPFCISSCLFHPVMLTVGGLLCLTLRWGCTDVCESERPAHHVPAQVAAARRPVLHQRDGRRGGGGQRRGGAQRLHHPAPGGGDRRPRRRAHQQPRPQTERRRRQQRDEDRQETTQRLRRTLQEEEGQERPRQRWRQLAAAAAAGRELSDIVDITTVEHRHQSCVHQSRLVKSPNEQCISRRCTLVNTSH